MRPLSPNLSATSLIRDTKKPMGHGRKAIETTPLSHCDAIDNRALKEQKVNAQPYIPIQ